MKRPPTSAPHAPLGEGSVAAFEAKKQEFIEDLQAGTVELRPFYWDLRNKIVRPWETVQTTRYFWFRWVPVIGPSYTLIIVNFRLLCMDQQRDGGDPTKLAVSHAKLAELSGLSLPTIKRALAPRTFRDPSTWFLAHFLRPYRRYAYDPKKGKKVRAPNGYQVAMDDPLLPEDEEALRGIYAEEEIRRLIEEGVVDLRKYAELKDSRPKDQFDPQVLPGPKDQFDPQVLPGPKDQFDPQVNPLKSLKVVEPQDQFDTQVQPFENKEEFKKTPDSGIKLIPLSSSSSNLKTTATTTDDGGTPAERPLTPKQLVQAIVTKFDGNISKRTAEHLIERDGFEAIRDQFCWFDYHDNKWADKGPAVAFVTYCRDQKPPPDAVREKMEKERRARQEAAAWRTAPIEARLDVLLSSWAERYRRLPSPEGEESEPLSEEIEDLTAALLPWLVEGQDRQTLFASLDQELEAVRRIRERAIESYERALEEALVKCRDGLLEVEQNAIAEEAKRRVLERGGDFVKSYMPKVMLEAIERELLLERVRENFPTWPEYWLRFRKARG